MKSKLFLLLLLAGFANQGGRATVTYPPTPLEGQGCPSDEDITQVIEQFHSLIEDRVEAEGTPETRLLAELIIAVEALSRDFTELSNTTQLVNFTLAELNLEVAEFSDAASLAEVLEYVINEPGVNQAVPAESCLEIFENSPILPSGNYWIRNCNGTAVQVYCDMARQCCNETTGGWTRVASLNMTDPNQQCPQAWREITAADVRTCHRQNDSSCQGVNYQSHGISYSRVCGRVTGYQYCSTDGFSTRIFDDIDVDGISVTRGSPREHVWTFVSGVAVQSPDNQFIICPCVDNPNFANTLIPSFVGNDYFCDTAYGTNPFPSCGPIATSLPVAYPLWDGGGCGPNGGCCESNNPPWFCKTLPQPTTDDIEVRICADEVFSNEDVLLELIEIYIN